MEYPVTLKDVKAARARIAKHVNVTPVLTSATMDRLAGEAQGGAAGGDRPTRLFFKCENFQKTGSFKCRGAHNAVFSLGEEAAARGVVTHSSGNHAQAVALAAKNRGIKATIVMPNTAPPVKKAGVIGYGATVVECDNSMRQQTADQVCEETGGEFVHPSNDPKVMAGQGTLALEFLEQVVASSGRPLDAIIVPLGGGGLISGVSAAAKGLYPGIKVYGAEPEKAADAFRSKRKGELCQHDENGANTIADGLRTTLGSNTFLYVRDFVDDVFLVPEQDIVDGMRLAYERMKVVIEPSAGTGIAVAVSPQFWERTGLPKGAHVGVVVCGGNIDFKGFFQVKNFQ
jgi:threonine dehydratase